MADLHELLVCPTCHGALAWDSGIRCTVCGAPYDSEDGIPLLVPAADDEHKSKQAQYFDEEADEEYEIDRPHGVPAFYGALLAQKLTRSLRGIGSIDGLTALTVCGGSGMEAEFLARQGAHVVTADISARAAARARERGRRYGVELTSIVADVERLPFADRSIDLVYVHDGLHHLEDPFVGLREMARVARRMVSVNEPARAGLTAAATRVGLALDREEAGNRVARLEPARVVAELRAQGLEPVHVERYALLYRHEPGQLSRLFSRRRVRPLAEAGLRAVTRPLDRFGNKLTVQAARAERA